MSSHSGTIGRKRGGSGGGGSGNSEYYFGSGDKMRRQRSAEWHSRHGYSSSEDEYQNTAQTSAFDTQLLAQLLLQSQRLANMDQFSSDCDTEATGGAAALSPYQREQLKKMQQQQIDQQQQQQHQEHGQSQENHNGKQKLTHVPATPIITTTTTTTNASSSNKFSPTGNNTTIALSQLTQTTRSTNPFLNAKFDSQSNSDSMSERLSSYSGSKNDFNELNPNVTPSSYLMPTALGTHLNSQALRSRSGRSLNLATSLVTSSSGTSSNSEAYNPTSGSSVVNSAVAAVIANKSEREKLKLQQVQMELREFAQTASEPLDSDSIRDDIRLQHFDIDTGDDAESEPPPEPAPPEIPPRTQSLLMSLRKHSDYKLTYEDKGDQKHEEFIPTSQLQQQHQQKGKLKRGNDCP